MCDTMVALPDATRDGSTLFAKNSDREPNEAQAICFYPRQRHPQGAIVRCTYVAIPQVAETNAVLLSRPFWMWGAEMGANEHGVVIGNEAVFARVRVPATGLTGMDLLRLALERASTARQALDIITDLLAVHGQGGSGGYRHRFLYHNSYLIADCQEAWVLETVDRHWAAQRVSRFRSISNGLTIEEAFDLASDDLVAYAVRHGWSKHEDFDFSRAYSDRLYTHFSACRLRQPQTMEALRAGAPGLTPASMMAHLRSHGQTADDGFTPAGGSNANICMHYADGLIRSSQTTASLVAHLRPDGTSTFWLTGTSAPCLSIFKPFYGDAPPAGHGLTPMGQYDAKAIWWLSERLHRAALLDYAHRVPVFAAERDALEDAFISEEKMLHAARPEERSAFSDNCVRRAMAATANWIGRVEAAPVVARAPRLYRRRWRKQNQLAGMPTEL